MAVKRKRSKRQGKKAGLALGRGRLFLLAGTVVILCVLLLFINTLYGAGDLSRYGIETAPAFGSTPSGTGTGPSGAGASAGANDMALASAGLSVGDGLSAAAGLSAAGGEPPIAIRPVDRTPPFDIPLAQDGVRLCFVIDDAGQNLEALEQYLAVPMPLAVAVMPDLPLTKESARMVVASGKELMLHQPMQSVNLDLWPGPGAIMPDMSLEQVRNLVTANLEQLGIGVRGMNNHEGSLITADLARIGAVLDAARDYGVFFMDSRTSSATKAPEAARSRGMSILQRDIFIDNVLEREAMLAQVYEGLELANKSGKAIMIGHVDKSADILPALLTELAPVLRERGYALVCPSQLVEKR